MRISKNNIIFIILMITSYIVIDFFIFSGVELLQMILIQLVLIVIAISPIRGSDITSYLWNERN